MEGYDERKLAYLLDVPTEKFTIPFIIVTGHSSSSDAKDSKEKARFPLNEIVYTDKFGVSMSV